MRYFPTAQCLNLKEKAMNVKWYHQLAAFFAGAFFFNCLPHLINGISGNMFPTPFSDPPGQGLSSSVTNVCWGFFNLAAAYLLIRVGKVGKANKWGFFVFFIGGLIMSIMLASHFVTKVNPYVMDQP
jgi:hypothetical protein